MPDSVLVSFCRNSENLFKHRLKCKNNPKKLPVDFASFQRLSSKNIGKRIFLVPRYPFKKICHYDTHCIFHSPESFLSVLEKNK